MINILYFLRNNCSKKRNLRPFFCMLFRVSPSSIKKKIIYNNNKYTVYSPVQSLIQ